MNAIPGRVARNWLPLVKNCVLLAGIMALFHWAWQERSLELSSRWNWYLLLGVVLSQLSVCAFSLRFRRVMLIVGVRLSVIEAMRITTLSMFYHFFVPLSAGADLTKFVKLRALAPARRKRAMAGGIMLEHAIGLASLVMTAVLLLVTLRPVAIDFSMSLLGAAAVLIVLAGTFVVLRRQPVARLELGRLVLLLRSHRADVAAAVALSLLMQCLLAAAVYAGSIGFGLDISYGEVLFVLAVSFVFQAVPASLIGIGVADLAGTGLYVALGLPLSAALLLVSLLYSYRILVALIGGLWELLPAGPNALPAALDT